MPGYSPREFVESSNFQEEKIKFLVAGLSVLDELKCFGSRHPIPEPADHIEEARRIVATNPMNPIAALEARIAQVKDQVKGHKNYGDWKAANGSPKPEPTTAPAAAEQEAENPAKWKDDFMYFEGDSDAPPKP